jgi:D-alanyl-D-alanine carboxypeptidase (penicillin-binding protein 5/6)
LKIKNINTIKLSFIIIGLLILIAIGQGQALPLLQPSQTVPTLNARSAILIDSLTGTVLFKKESSLLIPPASMTKLMSLYLVYKEIEDGRVSKDEIIRISREADFRSLPPRSSLMFLEEGQEVSMSDLMLGLAVPSGNDAAIAIGIRIAGSVDRFVEMMNKEAVEMGLNSFHFEDASGLSDKNMVTAADFVQFCSIYINSFPEALNELHSVNSFTYPKEENWKTNGSSVYGPITQYNRNNLLSAYAPIDGLKTGFIDESGYNVALTAQISERRLIAVLLGGPGETSLEGSMLRAIDGVNLLSYGFYSFTNIESDMPKIISPRVWKGSNETIELKYQPIPVLTLPTEKAAILQTRVDLPPNIIAPVKEGDILGEIIQFAGDEVIGRYVITAAEDAPAGGFFKRLFDSIRIFFMKLFGMF